MESLSSADKAATTVHDTGTGDTAPLEQLDEDVYEDAGDLEFMGFSPDIFLTRLPKYLWRTWSEMDDGQDVQVGRIRVEGALNNPEAISLLLSVDPARNRALPTEYSLQITNQHPSNIFVFTEKDLPGYNTKVKAFDKDLQDQSALPFSKAQPRAPLQNRFKAGVTKIDKSKRAQGYYRRAIPKKTALNGKVRRELNCLPVENEDFRRAMQERNIQEAKPIRETKLMDHAGVPIGGVYEPATAGNFIKTATATRAKGQENKTTRIPQNELMDLIVGCFKEHKYWTTGSLKDTLKQPETYLRSTLERVAELVRSGEHTNKWQLKPGLQDYIPETDDAVTASTFITGSAGNVPERLDSSHVKEE